MAEHPDLILSWLAEGNRRACQKGRAPGAGKERILSVALLTCTDERIVPEAAFDQPPRTFYTVRVAGALYDLDSGTVRPVAG